MNQKRLTPHVDPIYQTIELLGDAWSWMILREAIFSGVTRFGEFQYRLAIAPKILSARLSALVNGGLFRKLEGRDGAYRLTERGKDFVSCLLAAMQWGMRWESKASDPQVRIVHKTCGQLFLPAFCCSHCGAPVRSRDVAVVSMHRASSDLIGKKRQRMPDLDLIDSSSKCPIALTLRVLGDRWSSLVIRDCFLGTKRFSEFEHHLGIASNILSNRLDRLVRFGVLIATPTENQPSRFVYRLTEKGHDLYCVPLSLLTWGERWLARGQGRTTLTHKPCGHRLRAIFACAACGIPATFADIVFEDRERKPALKSEIS
jgi:DNA-binding HxlR family transcriptional regulator